MIHGTRKAIAAGCPCNLCVLVGAQMRDAGPESTSVPTSATRDHIEALLADGWTIARLAEHVGYGTSTLYGIRTGKWQFTSRYIAEDICSVPLGRVAA